MDNHKGDGGQHTTRRNLLVRGVGLVAGGSLAAMLGACSSTAGRANQARSLPSPLWPGTDQSSRTAITPKRQYEPIRPTTPPRTGAVAVIPRTSWSKGNPNYRNMARMQPINRITLHHDGMSPFTDTSYEAARDRIEAIRRAHAGQPGWGDIGYHYCIDPGGRVWEARSLDWQGAHVANQNPGNVGICVLGNYEHQVPTPTQLDTVEAMLNQTMARHRVPLANVHTHKELAPTACPGRNLQPRLVAMRQTGGALAMG